MRIFKTTKEQLAEALERIEMLESKREALRLENERLRARNAELIAREIRREKKSVYIGKWNKEAQ